ncbi:MAG: aminotransferase class III-fold pyridoxal phosphate-dependent enzyme, partial [Gammaproteobacteria bacterium]|nr:aminotransferase class III-fold pyridoxal phosphate-dependent enzyme [Gammaproteobacteria bacterium]
MQTAPAPLHAVATRGARIILADGRELVDGTSSWWTACHGYNHPHIRGRVIDQLQRMPHVMLGGLVHQPAESLAQRLAELLPGTLNHVFFSESGSVSVDVAMKMAVQFWLNQGVGNRSRFLSFRHGYHGDTIGAMSVCDPEEGMHALFAGLLPQQLIVDLPRTREQFDGFERLLDEHASTLAGVIMEPLVQAAGGMKFHSTQTLAAIADACNRHDLLLILDEIATGFGRTGSMFACEQANV